MTMVLSAGEIVTVETADNLYIGMLVPLDAGMVKVDTGRRGRPAILKVDDIEEILPADDNNPHVEK